MIVPAYNEADTIGSVVRAIAAAASGARVIVVDDGSSDLTAKIAGEAGAQIVSHAANRGYDAALDSGFAEARQSGCRFAVTLDADGQLPAERVGAFLAELQAGAGIVVGDRGRFQRFGEWAFAVLTRLRFGVRDPLCGMKGYDLRHHAALDHFDSYGSIGTELMLFTLANGGRLAQLPIVMRERADTPRFGRALDANVRILRAAAVGFTRYGLRPRKFTN